MSTGPCALPFNRKETVMSPRFPRAALNKMLRISHRLCEADCSLDTMEKLNRTDDHKALLLRLAFDRRQTFQLPAKRSQNDRPWSKIISLVASHMTMLMSIVMLENGGKMASVFAMCAVSWFVLSLSSLMLHNDNKPSAKHRVLDSGIAEIWLMQHAPEGRMLHARRALRLLIGYRQHFLDTQDMYFNALLRDTIGLYLYLLRLAVEQPQQSKEIQQYVTRMLPELVEAVLDVRMKSGDADVRAEYGAECRTVMIGQQAQLMQLLTVWQQSMQSGVTDTRGMKRQFRVMRESFIHDGLIDEDSADPFASEASVTSVS